MIGNQMKANVFFSIIVPVYNVEAYLEQCINSILLQSFKDYELILINDGSTDNCLEICKQYITKNPEIRLINQDNKGLSAARNSGLNIAKGIYTWFVDSDDYIEKDSLKKLYESLNQKHIDVLAFSNYHLFENTGEIKENNLNPTTEIYSNLEFINKKLSLEIAPWIYIYQTHFLKSENIQFREDVKIHEDEFFLLEVFAKLKTIKCIKDRLYIYRFRQNSLMRSNRVLDKIYSFAQLIYHVQTLSNNYLNKKFWNNRQYNNLNSFYLLYFKQKKENLNNNIIVDFKKIKKIKLKFNSDFPTGIKLMIFLHNNCFSLYKIKLLKI